MVSEQVTPIRGRVDICFVGLPGYIDVQTDRIVDVLERAGMFVEGGSFGHMDAVDVVADSPLAKALEKEGWK